MRPNLYRVKLKLTVVAETQVWAPDEDTAIDMAWDEKVEDMDIIEDNIDDVLQCEVVTDREGGEW